MFILIIIHPVVFNPCKKLVPIHYLYVSATYILLSSLFLVPESFCTVTIVYFTFRKLSVHDWTIQNLSTPLQMAYALQFHPEVGMRLCSSCSPVLSTFLVALTLALGFGTVGSIIPGLSFDILVACPSPQERWRLNILICHWPTAWHVLCLNPCQYGKVQHCWACYYCGWGEVVRLHTETVRTMKHSI